MKTYQMRFVVTVTVEADHTPESGDIREGIAIAVGDAHDKDALSGEDIEGRKVTGFNVRHEATVET